MRHTPPIAMFMTAALACAAVAQPVDAPDRPGAPAVIDELAGLSVHDDGPAVRWLALVRDPSALQRLVAIDELARAARFDARAASLVRALADGDSDQRVRIKAGDLAQRLPDRMTLHVRHAAAVPNGNGAMRTVARIGWKQYPVDELDVFAAAINHPPADAAAAGKVALAHGLNPDKRTTEAMVLAAGDERWAAVEPALVALGRIGITDIAAVSTTKDGLTRDDANFAIRPPRTTNDPPTQPIKVVVERDADGDGDVAIRVVGLSDPQPTPAALARVLRSLLNSRENPVGPFRGDDPLIVDAGGEVRWIDLVETLNAIAAAGYANVSLASVQGRPPAPGNDAIPGSNAAPAPASGGVLNTIDQPAGAADAVVMFGRNLGRAASVVYVVDASGSLIDTMPFVLAELVASIDRLPDGTRYNVVFFPDGQAVETPPKGMLVAGEEQRRRTRQWLAPSSRNIRPMGKTVPIAALALAFAYQPDLVVIVSDNITGRGVSATPHDTLMKKMAGWNPQKRTRVSTIQFMYPDPVATLEQIARDHGGVYVYVTERDLGLPEAPRARDEPDDPSP